MHIPDGTTLHWDGREYEVRDVTDKHVILFGNFDHHDRERTEQALHKRLVRRWTHDDTRSFQFSGDVSIPEPN